MDRAIEAIGSTCPPFSDQNSFLPKRNVMVLMGFTMTTPRFPLPRSAPPLGASFEPEDPGEVNEAEYWETIRWAWAAVTESAEACVLAVASAMIRQKAAMNER
jgi:hypothetical protein